MHTLGEAGGADGRHHIGFHLKLPDANGVATRTQPSVVVLTGEPDQTLMWLRSNGTKFIVRAMTIRAGVSS